MKVYGALEAAQIEWFTNAGKPAASSYPFRVIYVTDLKQIQVSDGTNWNPSALYTYTAGTLPAAGASNQYQVAFITDTLQVKVSNGTEWKTIGARLDTYTSGTIPAAASNTNSIIWVSDLQQVQVSNGTAWVQVGSKAGTKNYFTQNNANSDFETNSVSPWSACTLTFSSGVPSGAPTLTATQMSIATTATTPLSGTYSMLLTKSAANAQYQGFISGALTIDREDTAKVLYGSFYYEVVSGTIDLSGSSTQSLEIWIYNTVSGQWTQPSGYRGMNQSSGVGRVVFSFQTDGTYANNAYRIAVITQQTSTSAFVVEFDDFVVGPQAIVLGSAMTDWQSYTPTFTGLGTATAVGFTYRRVGDSIEIQGKFTVGTSTATEARISLPSGLTASDTTKIPSLSKVGSFTASYIEAFAGEVLAEPSVSYITLGKQGSGTPGLQKLNGNSVFGSSGQICSLFARIPIQGFGSFSQMSSDTDTRVVAFSAWNTSASTTSVPTGSTATKLLNLTTAVDTHAAWNNSTQTYTIPVSGIYDVTVSAYTSNFAGSVSMGVIVNGLYGEIATIVQPSATTATGNRSFYFNAGQQVSLGTYHTTGSTQSYGGFNPTGLKIQRLSGPSVVTATDSLNAKYYGCTSAISGTLATMTYVTKLFDSHSAYASGIYTLPTSGKFQINAGIWVNATFSASNPVWMAIFNGATEITRTYLIMQPFANSGNTNMYLAISDIISGNAGDQITIKAAAGGTSPTVYNPVPITNYFSIARVGN